MQAAVLTAPRALRLQGVRDPVPGPGEVLVRVRAAGICGTDYRIWSGERPVAYPLIPGHEFIGDVADVGSGVTRVRPGDRVAVEPNWGCGRCALCGEGRGNLCLARVAVGIDRDGGFAELAVLPERACWPAPAGVPDDVLLFTEPLAVVVRAVARGAPGPGETAAVVGAGTLGLLAVQVLRRRGCRVLAVARSDRRLGLARALGADAAIATTDGAEAAAAARRLAGRDGVDLAVETAGTAEAVELALGRQGFVRPGGRVILAGLPHAASRIEFFWVVRRELEIRGSMIYQDEFRDAVALLSAGAIEVAPLLTHRFALAELDRALAVHREPGSIKVAVFPGGGRP